MPIGTGDSSCHPLIRNSCLDKSLGQVAACGYSLRTGLIRNARIQGASRKQGRAQGEDEKWLKYLSHTVNRDKQIIHFFLEAFARTKVKPHLEEFEQQPPSGPTAEKIARDIQSSNALFVVLTETVESLPRTRDWITWECGTATRRDRSRGARTRSSRRTSSRRKSPCWFRSGALYERLRRMSTKFTRCRSETALGIAIAILRFDFVLRPDQPFSTHSHDPSSKT
jgi:hypothetical protein